MPFISGLQKLLKHDVFKSENNPPKWVNLIYNVELYSNRLQCSWESDKGNYRIHVSKRQELDEAWDECMEVPDDLSDKYYNVVYEFIVYDDKSNVIYEISSKEYEVFHNALDNQKAIDAIRMFESQYNHDIPYWYHYDIMLVDPNDNNTYRLFENLIENDILPRNDINSQIETYFAQLHYEMESMLEKVTKCQDILEKSNVDKEMLIEGVSRRLSKEHNRETVNNIHRLILPWVPLRSRSSSRDNTHCNNVAMEAFGSSLEG